MAQKAMSQSKVFQKSSIDVKINRAMPSSGLFGSLTGFRHITTAEAATVLSSSDPSKIRNLAIIAHVDHGKTTLVDCLLRQTGIVATERAMDSNDLEQERGITILSKCTSVIHDDHRYNIVDTPGHQDFGGEVERIMTMVEGVCLVVCATEGPMPQTKFVLQKALARGLQPIVVINKVDRPTSRVEEVESEIFDLFCNLEADDEQLDYPTIYAAAKDGWAISDIDGERQGVKDLLDTIKTGIPAPDVDIDGDFKMLITQTESNQYFGRQLIGKIQSGQVKKLQSMCSINQDGTWLESSKIQRIVKRFGMEEINLEAAYAGDIVSIAGLNKSSVGNIVNNEGKEHVIESIPIDPSMLSLTLTANDSPLKGNDGDKLTVSQLRERIIKESQDDVSLRVETEKVKGEFITMHGRGDLHLGVLLEKMRREGYEMAVCPPRVLLQEDPERPGVMLEPYELVTIDTDLEYVAGIIDKLNDRKAVLMGIEEQKDGRQLLTLKAPTRGLLGYRTSLTTDTRGTAQFSSIFLEYDEHAGDIKKNNKGALIQCVGAGSTTAYALRKCQSKGPLFVGEGVPTYEGMVIGEHVLEADMEMNAVKAKEVTNIRVSGAQDQVEKLSPPRIMALEEAIAYIRDDELVEVTPKHVRIRKAVLSQSARAAMTRKAKSEKQGRK